MSVCPHGTTWPPVDGFSLSFVFELAFKKPVQKIKVLLKSCKNNGYFKDVFTFMTISHWIVLRMRNVSNRSCTENQNTHFMFSDFFSWKLCLLWYNVEKYGGADRPQTIWRMRVACLMSNATRAPEQASTRAPTPHNHTRAHTQRCRNM